MTGELVTTVYRQLLRSSSHAVRHDRAACKNIRRLLRDDYEIAVRANNSEEELIKNASSTMLLHLASTRAKEDDSATNLLAHRTIRNLSSLCYHHLSPHTQMQPNTKKRRVGGTDTASLRKRRGSIGLKSGSSQDGAAIALGSFESGSTSLNKDTAPIDGQLLPSLVVRSKPVLGPIHNAFSRRFLPGRWDGQKTVKTIQTSAAFVAHLESMVESMEEEWNQAKEKYGRSAPRVADLLTQLRKVRGEVKSAKTKRRKLDERQGIQIGAADLLNSLVRKAQANNRLWLGANRFNIWATGAWLPP